MYPVHIYTHMNYNKCGEGMHWIHCDLNKPLISIWTTSLCSGGLADPDEVTVFPGVLPAPP